MYVRFVDEDGGDYSGFTNADLPGGKIYKIYFANLSPDIYTVESIVVDGILYENPEKYINNEDNPIDLGNLSDDMTITLGIAKAATKTVNVYGDLTIIAISLCKVFDDGQTFQVQPLSYENGMAQYEVKQGSNYCLYTNLQNLLAYKISSVKVDGSDAAFDSYGSLNLSSINADKIVIIQAEPKGTIKRIDVSMESDDNTVSDFGYAQFYEPSTETYGSLPEVLAGSTIQLRMIPDLGWKIKTIEVDGTDVTEAYKTKGYYEFAGINADHAVKVVFEKATVYIFNITKDPEPDAWFNVYLNDGWASYDNNHGFNEGTDVTLRVQSILQIGDTPYRIKIMEGENDITPDHANEGGDYEYVFSHLSANHNIHMKLELIRRQTITVKCNDLGLVYSLNGVGYDIDQPISFNEGTDVTFVISNIPDGNTVESVKIGETDVTESFNGSYTIRNLTEDTEITVTLGEASETCWINAYFDALSNGRIYLKPERAEKTERTWLTVAKGSKATIFVKTPIGYEVSNVNIRFWEDQVISELSEQNVQAYYDPATKEYYYVIENVSAPCNVSITTQKKTESTSAPESVSSLWAHRV